MSRRVQIFGIPTISIRVSATPGARAFPVDAEALTTVYLYVDARVFPEGMRKFRWLLEFDFPVATEFSGSR